MSIRQSDTAFPQGVNQRRDCPIHIKEMKQENFDIFKNCTGEVTSTDEELSYLDDVIHPFIWMRLLSATSSGASYVISTGSLLTSLGDGYRFCIQADQANQANPKITVDSVSAVNLVHSNGNAIAADFIPADSIFEVIYDSSETEFQLLKI